MNKIDGSAGNTATSYLNISVKVSKNIQIRYRQITTIVIRVKFDVTSTKEKSG